MHNQAWKLFFRRLNSSLEAFNFTDVYNGSYFTQRCSCNAYLTSFWMTSRNVKLTTTMTNCKFNYRLRQLASQFSSNRVNDNLFLSKGATFYLKFIIFWIYYTCYLVLFCEMMGKSMPLTMQELSKCSETLCQVWAIAPDKAAYCVFTQFHGPQNAMKFISVRTKTQ